MIIFVFDQIIINYKNKYISCKNNSMSNTAICINFKIIRQKNMIKWKGGEIT